jgi:hypothetical protein
MPKPSKAKSKLAKPASKPTTAHSSLSEVYAGVEEVLRRYVPPFKAGDLVVKGKESLQLVTPKTIVVPGAYGGKPLNWQFAAAILQKGYVGFYLMGAHTNPALKKKISPALLKSLKGKSCFQLKALDEQLKKDMVVALDASAEIYKERGWI